MSNQDEISNELYCKIFVDARVEFDHLISMLASFLGAKISGRRTVEAELLEVDVVDNDDFDDQPAAASFVYYRYYLDVVPARGVERAHYIFELGSILEFLWNAGFKAEAASSFEDELPRGGGSGY
jgi:hypothetical protein